VYILDTDVVSNLRKKKPHPALLSWIDEIGWQELAITVLTIMEIQLGIERARRSDVAAAESVEKWLSGLLRAGQPQVLALDTEAALLLGRMNETGPLRNFLVHDPGTKKTKRGADLAIASIAIAHKAVVTTGNSSDFLLVHEHFPLTGLCDPFLCKWLVKLE
jgi:predicted nucleic acid-binding protein